MAQKAKTKTWDRMSADEREAAVRRLMEAGGSNISVAHDLDTTPGAIAGLRRRKGIASTNEVPSMGKPKEEQEPVAAAPPPKPKLAASEATQCIKRDEEDGRQCGFERMPHSLYCVLHY